MQKTVLAFGETLWDLLPGGAKLGGAPFNFAYRVNSLGDRGLIISRLGRDELGDKAWDRIVALGMDTSFVQRDARWPTGTVEISFDENHNPDYYIVPGVAYDHIEPTGDLLAIAAKADCVCFGTLSQRAETARSTCYEVLDAVTDAVKLLDINLRKECFTVDTIRESLRRADVLRLNEEEALFVGNLLELEDNRVEKFGEGVVEKCSMTHCVVTLGERGAFVTARSGEKVYTPGYAVDLVDPCGSGDAFTAGFIHLLLRNKPLRECCELGNALGALVAAQRGATEPIRLEEVQAFVDSKAQRIVDGELKAFLQD